MSINEIFNLRNEYKNLSSQVEQKIKPQYDQLVSTHCTQFLKNLNDCVETKKTQLTKSYSRSALFWKTKEITDETKELIDYDSKVLCKSKYHDLSDCLDQIYMSAFLPILGNGDEKKFKERFYLYLKYNYVKDLK